MNPILNVMQKPMFDDSIIKKEFHSYAPYLKSFNYNDEIRIAIQNQDLYVLPCESYILLKGQISPLNVTSNILSVKLKNNFAAYLFDEIRYEINGFEVDRTRNLGTSSTMKNFISLNGGDNHALKNSGWCVDETLVLKDGYFSCCLPLKMMLGFAEDYNKIILNCKHEIVLQRSKSDDRVFCSTDANAKFKLQINDILWKIPHITLSDVSKLQMFKVIKSGSSVIIPFRSWDCHVNPALPSTTKVMWNVKLSTHNERPRFIILGLQTKKERTDGNIFDHCNINNLKVFLNSETYPYDDLNINFEKGQYGILYNMYLNFQQSYYHRESQPILDISTYATHGPLLVVDVSHQNETVKTGPIDIRVEIDTLKNIPHNT